MTSKLPRDRPVVGSVVQAIAVLRHLGGLGRGQGVTAIARTLGISPSSCFNILKTLVAEGVVDFDPTTKSYALGAGTVDLAYRALRSDAVLTAARSGMERLAERFDAAIGLWRISGGDRLVLVSIAESEASTRVHLVTGQRQPIASGATGRCVMAARGLDDEEIARLFAILRWGSAPTLAAYLAQVKEARERGWAIDVDQFTRGITSVAAPIADVGGEVRFCLSATMFTRQHGAARVRAIGEAVRDVAAGVSHGGASP